LRLFLIAILRRFIRRSTLIPVLTDDHLHTERRAA
jgi:hypothetical protein